MIITLNHLRIELFNIYIVDFAYRPSYDTN